MLKIFRSGASSKILFGFLGLALFAMVVTGFGTGGGGLGDLGGGGDTIAEVGSGRIGSTEVADQANRQFARARDQQPDLDMRSEEHTAELQSLMRSSYAVFCLKK